MRSFLIGVGIAFAAAGLYLLFQRGVPEGGFLVCAGVLLLAGIVFERVRYKTLEKTRPGSGWLRTAERFVDPETGKTVTVYIEPLSGERRYVRE